MKLLTVMIPCYNSAEYMHTAVESLLCVKDDLEILIINDGSTKDNTAEIADSYAEKYPESIKAIHQENKGHGGAINTGIAAATGKYFKVLDSDDHFEESALKKTVETLKNLENSGNTIDMFITNYVYDKVGKKIKKVMKYNILPKDRVFDWEEEFEIGGFEYILMHSIMYRTEVLRNSGMILPEKISYEDDLYAFAPLEHVHKLYYLDVDLYMYFIGRADQTVNEKNMIKKRHQYQIVTEMIIDSYLNMDKNNIGPMKKRYMLKFMDMMMCLASIVLVISGSKEDYEIKEAMWARLKHKDDNLYIQLKNTFFGKTMNLSRKHRLSVMMVYKIAKKIVGFN